jgi:phosphate transport system substrate-binding protein
LLFNFMTNLGPNAQTYLLAGEVFPTAIRGKGAGFAAAVGKIGAVATAFLFPILLASIGTTPLLCILVVTSILGAIITWIYRIETTGMNLDEIGRNAEKLNLDGTVLAGIYSGKIRFWDTAPIAALNPNLKLPHHVIIPIHRADGSGDTFIFTQFLSFSDPDWANNQGCGMVITWPVVEGTLEAHGNIGIIQTIQKTAYSLGYIGVSYAADIANAGLGTAWLKNESGNFLLPTKEAVQAAAADLGSRTPPDERLTIVLSPGAAAYPLVSYEYAIVSTKQADAATAAAIRKFLLWAIVPSETNESYLDSVHFIGLPPHIWELSQAQIQTIK